MKHVILSADNAPSVYSVPEIVADNLNEYCLEFRKWLWESPHAKKYHYGTGVCYTEEDFIEYLNTWVYPDKPSLLIETLEDIYDRTSKPQKYKHCEWYNF